MIRTAFLGVIVLAGLLAFGAFYLARGSEGEIVEVTTGTADGPAPVADVPETPEVEKLYFLRGIDLEIGEITLVLFDAGPARETLVVRDVEALRAAQDSAYVNTASTAGDETGSFLLALMGEPPSETFAQIFRDDVLIGWVSCADTACASFADNPDIDYAGLLDVAMPLQRVDDNFDDYDAYLATIAGIADDPNYMLLHARPPADFPAERRLAKLTIQLPNVIVKTGDDFTTEAHTALVRDTLAPLLP